MSGGAPDCPVRQSMFLSKDIVYQNGKPAYLVDLSKGFEWLFNIINQQMTEYQIYNNTGIFTVEDTAPADSTKAVANSTRTDSIR